MKVLKGMKPTINLWFVVLKHVRFCVVLMGFGQMFVIQAHSSNLLPCLKTVQQDKPDIFIIIFVLSKLIKCFMLRIGRSNYVSPC